MNVLALHCTETYIWYTYKALRSAGGLLRSLRKEKYIELREADKRSMIEYTFFMIVVNANWRLDNARSHMPYVRMIHTPGRELTLF